MKNNKQKKEGICKKNEDKRKKIFAKRMKKLAWKGPYCAKWDR